MSYRSFLQGALIATAIFIAGMAAGVYYQAELLVWWRAIVGGGEPVSISVTPPLVQPASTPTLSLAMLPSPLPLIYSDTLEEEKVQEYLKLGAVVLPLGTSFGEPGNVVVTAHSSGTEAFGPHRFAFAKLSELQTGQEFTIDTPDGKYIYRVYGSDIVWPHEVDKLPQDDRSTVTLVTCWPLWTNFKRLLVHGELIQADPV